MKFFIYTLFAISVCCEVAVCNSIEKSKPVASAVEENSTGKSKSAAPVVEENLSDKELLNKIENYFYRSCDSFSARFYETHGLYGPTVQGTIYLKRSAGKMKMRYDDSQNGDPLTIIVKDFQVTIYNRDLMEKTVIPITASPLGFLLHKELKLNERLRVISITRQIDTISVELAKKSDDSEGTITLIFHKQPFSLVGWIIFEKNSNNQGRRVRITLEEISTKAKIENKIFESFS